MTDFARYLNIRSAQMPVLSPDGSRVAFLSDITGNLQVWSAPTAPDSREWPRQLTFFADKVWEIHGTGGGDHLLAVGDVGGNERQQFYLISGYGGEGGHEVRRLTSDDNAIHRFGGFSGDGQRILYAANGRNGVDFDLFQMDVADGESHLLCELSGNQEVMAWSLDEEFVLTRQQVGPLEDRLFLIDLHGEGNSRQPWELTAGTAPARYEQVRWGHGGVYLLSDRTHDRGAICRLDLESGELSEIVNADAHSGDGEMEALAMAANGAAVYSYNEGGYSRLWRVDLKTGERAAVAGLPDGQIGHISVKNNGTLVCDVQTPQANLNVARELQPAEIGVDAAYDLLVAAGKAPVLITPSDIKSTLSENIVDGRVGSVLVGTLTTDAARREAYQQLVDTGLADAFTTPAEMRATVAAFRYFEIYKESSGAVTTAAEAALEKIARNVGINQTIDLTLDALSLGSIYFLAAIGLAITFGVMGVINMAHGEFIMMGAYTGYVVQQFVPNHTASIIVAIPLAFAVTFAAGVAMERLVIRWLYNRPLETLLATFGISIALQQLAKNIFGTQARPLTSPGWLDGALVINDVVAISYIRIAIFVLAMIFLGVFLFIMKRTRLGLETRAVTQNPRMAASMGINPNKVNMLTFGLGSGIAGVAGVAIGLFAKVTSELGSDYIVQSFMTVVVGGVGNIWGTLAGAAMIGFLQKGIEWFNPSNTLAAQTYMIVFIIIFIQFRPRGIIALKGRAAGD